VDAPTLVEDRMLLVGAVLLLAVLAALAARRLSVPVLVAFLALGMLLGSEGPGGIHFDDPDVARAIGVVALIVILFEGGLTTNWRDIRPILVPAGVLSTFGVFVTAAVTGLGAYVLFDLSPREAFLLGAVVGSTDAAAVFATLRFTTLRRRLAALLEAESGANDPMAIALTLGMIAWLTEPAYGAGDVVWLLARQLGLGLILGLALGVVAALLLRRLPVDLGPFSPVASLAIAALSYGLVDLAGGSGFLAVYVVALFVGNTPTPLRRSIVGFHEGLAFLAQVILFVVLGLFVFPSELVPVAASAIALAAVLTFLARPLAVVVSLPLQAFTVREQALVAWGGLRGAVPIVLATFVLSAGIEASDTIFNAVFFVVVLSALAQGLTLEPLARRLGLATEARPFYQPPLEVGVIRGLGGEILEYAVARTDAVAGSLVRDLALPPDAVVMLIVRDDRGVPPRGSTRVEAGDRLYILATAATRNEVADLLRRWEDGPMPAPRPGHAPPGQAGGPTVGGAVAPSDVTAEEP
jgi:cell volume regulation protein A